MSATPDSSSRTYVVLLVRSVSHAMKAEAALARACISYKLIPVPRSLSSHCGVCVRVDPADRERAERTLTGAGVEITGIYEVQQTSRTRETTDGRPKTAG